MTTPLSAGPPLTEADLETLLSDFERLYEKRYGRGSAYRAAGIELVTFRLRSRGLLARPAAIAQAEHGADPGSAQTGERSALRDAVKAHHEEAKTYGQAKHAEMKQLRAEIQQLRAQIKETEDAGQREPLEAQIKAKREEVKALAKDMAEHRVEWAEQGVAFARQRLDLAKQHLAKVESKQGFEGASSAE